MQVCTSLQTDHHASTPSLRFLQAGCRFYHPANSVKALKPTLPYQYNNIITALDYNDCCSLIVAVQKHEEEIWRQIKEEQRSEEETAGWTVTANCTSNLCTTDEQVPQTEMNRRQSRDAEHEQLVGQPTDQRSSCVMPNSHRPPDTTRQCCLCRVWHGGVNFWTLAIKLLTCSDFKFSVGDSLMSCQESRSHRRGRRDTDRTVLSGLALRCELGTRTVGVGVNQRALRRAHTSATVLLRGAADASCADFNLYANRLNFNQPHSTQSLFVFPEYSTYSQTHMSLKTLQPLRYDADNWRNRRRE